MKNKSLILIFLICSIGLGQDDINSTYKKKVLENIEIDFLSSYYTQEGNNASVTGGIGTEELNDFNPTIIVTIPLNDDDIISLDYGISTYSSASSSNGNPFDAGTNRNQTSSPWYSSSGASKVDTWRSLNIDYSHATDDRNVVITANISNAKEWDYESFGFGVGITKLSNNKNTSYTLSTKIYIDNWIPIYPKELDSYVDVNGDTEIGFFYDKIIYDQNGLISNKWSPPTTFTLIDDKSRNTYSFSFLFSQILNKNSQLSLFVDFIKQEGWLANPLQRVYFSDVNDFYIGNPESIALYDSRQNKDVFHLADDIERLPKTRTKIPLGVRFNYYLNENLTIRSFYRFYTDDWGINSHTFNLEFPVKVLNHFTFYPSYRFYAQTKAKYFQPYNKHLSTSEFYTSDYDLSKFRSNQFGFGFKYTDIFTKLRLWSLGLKSIDLNYGHYSRDNDFKSEIISLGIKFAIN